MYWSANNQGPSRPESKVRESALITEYCFMRIGGEGVMLYYKGQRKSLNTHMASLLKTYLGPNGIASRKWVLTKKHLLDHITEPWKRQRCMRIWGATLTRHEVLPRLPLFTFPLDGFMDAMLNTKQFHSLVLSSVNLEKSVYYLILDCECSRVTQLWPENQIKNRGCLVDAIGFY